MHLCFIANPNSIHIQRWIGYFIERGHEISVIGIKRPRHAFSLDVALYDLSETANIRGLRYIAWWRVVRRLIRDIRPDILHAHQISGGSWLGAAVDYHPFVVTAWGSDLLMTARRSWIRRQLARWVLSRADYVTCVSQNLADSALVLGASPERLEVAPWGVNMEVFHPGDRPRATTPTVLSIRAMRDLYNPLDIAGAIPQVLRQVPRTSFVVRTYGSDPVTLSSFKKILKESGADKHVTYVGDLPNDHAIADLYRKADVAISVPFSDGNPLSVMEALACGCVPVLSDIPSLREWVTHEGEGLFVRLGNKKAIADAIIRLITDESLRRRMRRDGICLIRERADSKVWMRRMEEIYKHLTEQSWGK